MPSAEPECWLLEDQRRFSFDAGTLNSELGESAPIVELRSCPYTSSSTPNTAPHWVPREALPDLVTGPSSCSPGHVPPAISLSFLRGQEPVGSLPTLP